MTELDDAAYQAEGEALVTEILAHAAPLMEGKSPKLIVQVMAGVMVATKLIVQVMAGVMVATILLAARDDDARREMLRLTAAALIKFADGPAMDME
jgi:hypothetical protein